MSIRSTIESIIEVISIDPKNNMEAGFNFIILEDENTQQFHVDLNGPNIELNNDLAEDAIGILESKESTLQALLDLGFNPVEALMNVKIPSGTNDFDLPDSDEKIFLETMTPSGIHVKFSIFILNKKLYLKEGEVKGIDIRIKIKSNYLTKLISGDFNLPMALITGKIKIRNKTGLMRLLGKLGLNF